MKKLLLLVCCVLVCATAYAGDKEHRELADKLMEMTNEDEIVERVRQQMNGTFSQLISMMNVQDSDKAKLDAYTKRFNDILGEGLNWPEVKTQFRELYVKTFTEAEIKGLIDFYSSDLSKSIESKMPGLMQERENAIQAHVQAILPKLEALTQEMGKEFAPPAANQTAPTAEDPAGSAEKNQTAPEKK